MKSIYLISFQLLLLCAISYSQQIYFSNEYSTLTGNNILQTFDGGYIVGGSWTNQSPLWNCYVTKLDSNGGVTWSRRYQGAPGQYFRKIIETSDSGYIIVADCYPDSVHTDSSDILLIKIRQNGDTTWTRCIGGPGNEQPFSIAQSVDGGYMITGLHYLPASGPALSYLSFLVKTDRVGNVIWSKEYNSTIPYQSVASRAVVETADKCIAFAGMYKDDSLGTNSLVVKTDPFGNILWQRIFGQQSTNVSYEFASIELTSDDGFILSGQTHTISSALYRVNMVKVDLNGNLQWGKTFGSLFGLEDAYTAFESNNSEFVLAARSYGFTGYIDPYFIKTNQIGDTIWTRLFDGAVSGDQVYGNSTSDGGIIIVAALNLSSLQPTTVIKTDSNGNFGACEVRPPTLESSITGTSTPALNTINMTYISSPYLVEVYATSTSQTMNCLINNITYTETDDEIQILSNPVSEYLRVKFNNKSKLIRITIFDSMGNKCIELNNGRLSEMEINVSFLKAGIYLISADGKNFHEKEKFIKQ
jgi:hypothetical protein